MSHIFIKQFITIMYIIFLLLYIYKYNSVLKKLKGKLYFILKK